MPGIGNCGCETRDGRTQSRRMEVSTKQLQIAELAATRPEESFTSLNHYLDMDWMKEAYRRTRRESAPGVDGQTMEEYGSSEGLCSAAEALWEIRPESPSNQNPTDPIWPPLHGAGGQPEDSGTRKGRIRLSWLHPLLGEDSQRRVCGQTQDSRQADEPGPQSD